MTTLTKFQQTVKRELLQEVVKFFHPNIPKDALERIRWHTKYSWVCIEFRAKDYGYISIGINNHDVHPVIWGPITKDFTHELFESGRVRYRIWRFADDCLFKKEDVQEDRNVVFFGQIPNPTEEEFYDYYMRD